MALPRVCARPPTPADGTAARSRGTTISEAKEEEVTAFLTDLATRHQVSASTQNQALSALLFLYRHVIGRELGRLPTARARRKRKLPVVLTRQEVGRLLEHLDGVHHLIATLLYGSGLRLMEGLRLRVKDVDLDYEQITVRDGKGAIYTHVLNRGGRGVRSPFDRL